METMRTATLETADRAMFGSGRRWLTASTLCAAATLFALGSCSSGGGSSSTASAVGGSSLRIEAVEFGRLVDVYGFDANDSIILAEKDVMIGSDIKDQRPANSAIPNEQILFDFLSADPDTLQPRLLITRRVGSSEFDEGFDQLDDRVRELTPARFGSQGSSQAFSVMPRNAAVRLTFTQNVGVDLGFFVEYGPSGEIVGQLNTEAVQLLEIVGDPNDGDPTGDFRVIPSRVVPRGRELIIDPVLLGSEGLQYQTRNNAAGLPESPDQSGANIRIAIALEGPLALPGVRADRLGNLEGTNNSGQESVIRDFRSGNRNDTTPEISKGFVRDPLAPRISGQIVMYLEQVQQLNAITQVLTFYKNGVNHEIDVGDAVRLVVDNSGVPATVSEVVVDPVDDSGQPSVQHVRVVVRRQVNRDQSGGEFDVFEEWDPSDPSRDNMFWQVNSGIPDYPDTIQAREPWLAEYAPKLVLVAEYTFERTDPNGNVYGDDPRYFVTFSPAPLPGPSGPGEPNQNVSPFAGAVLRFTKPVDMTTVKALDTFFFATRDLLDETEEALFITEQGIDSNAFIRAKYYTPHLVGSKVFDEDGSQTNIRLQPSMGFYLDDNVRQDEGVPFALKEYKYFLHLVGGLNGIKDLSGNAIDFQSQLSVRDNLVIPFSLDTRRDENNDPVFEDNLAISVARRFEDADEDEQPSYYLADEVPAPGAAEFNPKAFNLQDVFGPVVYLTDGTLSARPTARVRQVVDDLNQQTPPPQDSTARYCPFVVGGENQVVTGTAGAKFGAPLQNPLNPFGCRLQTVWREVDMSLSRTDPIDFNLDVEQLYWAPFTDFPTVFDELDRMSLFLGHAERRPEPCVGSFSSLPTFTNSGLVREFDDNLAFDLDATGSTRSQQPSHPAFVDQILTILPSDAVFETNGVNRFLPLPPFEKPYFVWRDELVLSQGGNARFGDDSSVTGNNFTPYILSPFLTGRGRYATVDPTSGVPQFNNGAWDNRNNSLITRNSPDDVTGGLVGSIALPLLADFWVYPDSASLPVEDPFLASGANGWQIALAVQSSPLPAFRSYSAGGIVMGQPKTIGPTDTQWALASGGFQPNGKSTNSRDNTVFWLMADYVKRQSVVTNGFVEILNPHRMPDQTPDPRLGPFLNRVMPTNYAPNYAFDFEPPLTTLPGGTAINVAFRGASRVDQLSMAGSGEVGPWAAIVNQYFPTGPQPGQEIPDETNFPLDPLKAGDAHIRKFDDREVNGQKRNTWTYYYNRHVTDYVPDPNTLADSQFTNQFSGLNETFLANDVTYFNWRFVFENNVDANPPITPVIDSFIVTYRLEKKAN